MSTIIVYTLSRGHFIIAVQLLQMVKHIANLIVKQKASGPPISKRLANIF